MFDAGRVDRGSVCSMLNEMVVDDGLVAEVERGCYIADLLAGLYYERWVVILERMLV